jgi:hypothetical protein
MTQQPTDDHLDLLLARTAVPMRPEAVAAAVDLARAARSVADVSRRPRHWRRWVVAVAVGVTVLTGAGTVTAYELSVPPFQELPEGTARIDPPIVAEYDGVDGARHRCLVFPEFINLTRAQDDAARAWAQRQDWTGYGERLAAGISASTPEAQEEALFDAVGRDLRARFAEQMVPDVVLEPVAAQESGRAGLSGFGGSCRTVPDAD